MAGALRLLLVDDDAVDRARVRRLLDARHTVTEAATAADGRAAAHGPADAVLLDLRLPDADGLELVPWFAERGLPVIMLTGVEDAAVVVDAMQRGATDYLVKGQMTAASLDRALRQAVETAALRRAVDEQRQRLEAQARALADQNREIQELASALTLAEQAERSRIALVLHDHLQQVLYGARLLTQSLPSTDDEGRGRIAAALDESIAITRRLTLDLTPPVLDAEDLSVAVRWAGEHAHEVYGLRVDVEAQTGVVVARRDVRVLLVELVRELLFNVAKHAGTGRARLGLAHAGGVLTLTVEDDGRGFDPAVLSAPLATVAGGIGLYSVRGRIELVGGTFAVRSTPGAGTRVTLALDLGADGRGHADGQVPKAALAVDGASR